MDEQEFLAERFEEHRTHLRAVGYRMLGSLSEADDAVQEVWLMLAGFLTVYLNCHAIAHYLAGRLVGLRFRGYGVRGTDHPEVYPPGIRQLMQAAPFYVTLSTKDSRSRPAAGPRRSTTPPVRPRPPSARSLSLPWPQRRTFPVARRCSSP